jgi:hypothetical protein
MAPKSSGVAAPLAADMPLHKSAVWVLLALTMILPPGIARAQGAEISVAEKRGQAQSIFRDTVKLSDGRCALIVPFANNVKDATLAVMASESACNGGLLDGAVTFGYGWTHVAENGTEESRIGLMAGIVSQGTFAGPRIVVWQRGVLMLDAFPAIPDGKFVRFVHGQEGYSLERLLGAINNIARVLGGPHEAAVRDHLSKFAQAWDRDPFGMMRQFTSQYGQTVQNPYFRNVAAAQPLARGDDPKVRGRSARGG